MSEGNRRLTRTQYVADLTHSEIVRNPFGVDYEIRLPWPEKTGPWRIAFVGRLEPEAKGCDLLLDVLSAEKWRKRDLIVSFLGAGRSADSVKAYAELLQLPKVRFQGYVANVADIWKENQLLVLPSRLEGLPIAIVEAMLCRRPCIVTDVGGNREVIEDNVTGFIAAAPTVAHLDEAMERAWAAREQWSEMGERAGLSIRTVVPRDPVAVFADKLIELASSSKTG